MRYAITTDHHINMARWGAGGITEYVHSFATLGVKADKVVYECGVDGKKILGESITIFVDHEPGKEYELIIAARHADRYFKTGMVQIKEVESGDYRFINLNSAL